MNLNTKKISITRDLKWLNKMYYDHLHRNGDNKSEQDSNSSLAIDLKIHLHNDIVSSKYNSVDSKRMLRKMKKSDRQCRFIIISKN